MKPLFLCSALWLGACPLLAQSSDDREEALYRGLRDEEHNGPLVPGSRIENVRLGQNRAQVRQAMKRAPTSRFSLPGGLSSELWKWVTADSLEICSLEALYRGGRVVQIEVVSPYIRPAGIEVDAPLSKWARKFGSPQHTSVYAYNARRKGVARQKYLDWPSRGLALETRRSSDDDGDFVQTAIVHPVGTRVIVDFDGKPVSR